MVVRWTCFCQNCGVEYPDAIGEEESNLPDSCHECGAKEFSIDEKEDWREVARKEEFQEEPDMHISTVEQMEKDKHWQGKR